MRTATVGFDLNYSGSGYERQRSHVVITSKACRCCFSSPASTRDFHKPSRPWTKIMRDGAKVVQFGGASGERLDELTEKPHSFT